jgi:mediator of RNA polymerase II transcription subunit 12
MQALNSITLSTDLPELALRIFGTHFNDATRFARKLDMLLSWAVSPAQCGTHRPYTVVALLRHWCAAAEERASRRDTNPPHEFLHDQLFDWLDESYLATDAVCLPEVANLYGELVEKELFLYTAYVQRLIARGESGLLITSVSLLVQGILRMVLTL